MLSGRHVDRQGVYYYKENEIYDEESDDIVEGWLYWKFKYLS